MVRRRVWWRCQGYAAVGPAAAAATGGGSAREQRICSSSRGRRADLSTYSRGRRCHSVGRGRRRGPAPSLSASVVVHGVSNSLFCRSWALYGGIPAVQKTAQEYVDNSLGVMEVTPERCVHRRHVSTSWPRYGVLDKSSAFDHMCRPSSRGTVAGSMTFGGSITHPPRYQTLPALTVHPPPLSSPRLTPAPPHPPALLPPWKTITEQFFSFVQETFLK